MKKIKILLTFDYELPLGFARDYEAGLFQPASALFERANRIGVPLVMFADICSAIRFEEWDKKGYHDPFVEQLGQGLRGGHDLQLHVHPHWMTSEFTGNSFRPSADFSLSQFRIEKGGYTIEGIIEEAHRKLVSVGKSVLSDYRCVAYRAGGYDVEPESKRILHKLAGLGVVIDSSVIKNFYVDYNFTHVDYTGAPESSSWLVSLNGPLIKPATEGILELPITSKPISLVDIMARRMKKLSRRRVMASRVYRNKGIGLLAFNGKQTFRASIRKIFNPNVLSLDKEYLEVDDLVEIVDYNVKKYKDETGDLVLTAIGHPKSMGSYHLDLMQGFVERVNAKYGKQVAFTTYKDLQRER